MRQKPFIPVAVSIMLTALLPHTAAAAQATVAVAANFAAPMKVIAREVERATGHTLTLSFGATGQFYAQIKNGAPFAVLLSADDETPARLEKEGLAVSGSRFTYAIGRLVLWSKSPDLIDAQASILTRGEFEKIAIANPKLAPYGAASLETLQRLGLAETLRPKFVEGANIGQTFQFVASQSAALGFVALSQVVDNGKIKEGSGWVVPLSYHSPLRQDAILLNPGKGNAAAEALLHYLRTDRAKATIRAFGYDL